MQINKKFITPNQLYRDAYHLAHIIIKSGFKPDILLVMWRGGSPIGIVVHEYLAYHGINASHSVVKAQSYTGIAKRKEPVFEGIEYLLKQVPRNAKVLIVDDIFDTGSTVTALKDFLSCKTSDVKTSAAYFKMQPDPAARPDFFVRRTKSWIVFPHELVGLSRKDIQKKGRHVHHLINNPPGSNSL